MPQPAFSVEPVRRRKVSDEVAERLQELMIGSELRPGDELPSERELMAMFGVGRTSVREALVVLHRMGLIEVRNGERARVTKPSAASIVDGMSTSVRMFLAQPRGESEMHGARVLLESMLARNAAEHARPADVERLRLALDANERAIGDLGEFARTDLAFHLVLAEVTGNSIFPALHGAMAGWLAEQRNVSLRADGAELVAFASHRAIYAAVAAADADAAEAAMREHLGKVHAFYAAANTES